MAVKNTKTRNYEIEYNTMCSLLRNPDFSKCLGVNYIEQAILSDCVEFRYVRKTDFLKRMDDYGRNYFIRVKKIGENVTSVSVTTQSRKITVLHDSNWVREVDKVFEFIDILLRR